MGGIFCIFVFFAEQRAPLHTCAVLKNTVVFEAKCKILLFMMLYEIFDFLIYLKKLEICCFPYQRRRACAEGDIAYICAFLGYSLYTLPFLKIAKRAFSLC